MPKEESEVTYVMILCLFCWQIKSFSQTVYLCTVIGVPLLLAYVYGVVPLSLCRSIGSCGIRTVSTGVRLGDEDCTTLGRLSVPPFHSTSSVGR